MLYYVSHSKCVCVCEHAYELLWALCVHTVFVLSDMILGVFHMDNCHRIQWESRFIKVTVCGDHRVFVFMNQAVLFSSALSYHFASVFPGILAGVTSLIIHWLNTPDCLGSWPIQRWRKWWFTGVTTWHCRWSYKHWGKPVLALFRPSSQWVRFIVNYG